MPTFSTAEFPRPTNWDEFEKICWDLFRREWNDPNTVRHGRSGQEQFGVDLYGQQGGSGPTLGVQCKLHVGNASLPWREVTDEVTKGEAFTPTLGAFTIATTAPRDARIQVQVRELSATRVADGRFPVNVLFWDDLCERMANYLDLLRTHYPSFFVNDSGPARTRGDAITAFRVNTSAVGSSVSIVGLGTMPRPELAQLEATLVARPVLLVGGGGTGKSGLARLVANRAESNGLPVLVVDAAMLPSGAESPAEIGQSLVAPIDILSDLRLAAEEGPVLFIVDQLDSVANQSAGRSLAQLLRAAANAGIRTMAVCRRYDAEMVPEYVQLQFDRVGSEDLSADAAIEALGTLRLDSPPGPLVSLARNLLGLSLIADLVRRNVDVRQIEGELELWDAYRRDIAREEPLAETEAFGLAWTAGASPGRGAPIVGAPNRAVQVLLGRSVLDERSRLGYRFRHERIRDYLIALDAARQGLALETLRSRLPETTLPGVLRWLLALLHADDEASEIVLVQSLLADANLEFSTRAIALEALCARSDPSDSLASVLLPLLDKPGYSRYFFAQAGASWLEPLTLIGGFSSLLASPDPHPALGYLRTHAGSQSAAVATVLVGMAAAPAWIIDDLFEIATALGELSDAARSARTLANAIDTEGILLSILAGDKAADLIIRLADGGQAEAGITLMRTLLRPFLPEAPEPEEIDGIAFRPNARAPLEVGDARELLESVGPSLCAADAEATRSTLEDLLIQTLELEEDRGYLSCIWRPAIENHEQNQGEGHLRRHLLVALRDVAESASASDPVVASQIIDRYLQHEVSLFRRLGVHLLRLNRVACEQIVNRVLQSPEFVDADDSRHERYLLVQESFGNLPAAVQQAYLEVTASGVEDTSTSTSDELAQRRHRALNALWPARAYLTPDWRGKLEALVADLGEPIFAEFLSPSGSRDGDLSPTSATELAALSIGDLIDTVVRFEPSGHPLEPTQSGLAQQMTLAIRRDGARYSAEAAQFLDERLPAEFISAYVRGLIGAMMEPEPLAPSTPLDWSSTLNFCLVILDRILQRDPTGDDSQETPWTTVAGDFLLLVEFGIADRLDRIPAECLERARDVLLLLAKWPIEWDALDPLEILVHPTIREKSIKTLIAYAARRATLLQLAAESRLEPQIKTMFEAALDPSRESTLRIHGVFGANYSNLAYLDRVWIDEQRPLIFPADRTLTQFWRSAWIQYIISTRLYESLYRELDAEYRRAISALGDGSVVFDDREGKDATQRLGEALAIAYVYGWEDLNDSNGRFLLFLQVAPEYALSRIVWLLGSVLRDRKPNADSDLWLRLKAYWQIRVDTIQATGSPSTELRQVALWLDDIPVTLGEIKDVLDQSLRNTVLGWEVGSVVEYLAEASGAFPLEAMQLLQRIDELTSDQLKLGLYEDAVQIVRAALRRPGSQAEALARRFVSDRADRGDVRYLQLLDV